MRVGCAQSGGAVWRHGGIDGRPHKVIASIKLQAEIAQQVAAAVINMIHPKILRGSQVHGPLQRHGLIHPESLTHVSWDQEDESIMHLLTGCFFS